MLIAHWSAALVDFILHVSWCGRLGWQQPPRSSVHMITYVTVLHSCCWLFRCWICCVVVEVLNVCNVCCCFSLQLRCWMYAMCVVVSAYNWGVECMQCVLLFQPTIEVLNVCNVCCCFSLQLKCWMYAMCVVVSAYSWGVECMQCVLLF